MATFEVLSDSKTLSDFKVTLNDSIAEVEFKTNSAKQEFELQVNSVNSHEAYVLSLGDMTILKKNSDNHWTLEWYQMGTLDPTKLNVLEVVFLQSA